MSLTIGNLRARATIQQPSITRDGYGAEVKTWVLLTKLWGEFSPAKNTEVIRAQQQQTNAQYTLKVPFDDRVTTDHRAVVGGVDYDITLIDKSPYDGEMLLYLSEST